MFVNSVITVWRIGLLSGVALWGTVSLEKQDAEILDVRLLLICPAVSLEDFPSLRVITETLKAQAGLR